MAFSHSRCSSMIDHPSHSNPEHEDDHHRASAFQAALSTFVPGSSSHADYYHDTNKEKNRVGIQMIVEFDCLILKGTGADFEPAVLIPIQPAKHPADQNHDPSADTGAVRPVRSGTSWCLR
ncbi:hypothetical protein PAXINDRAFT_167036 [Paxillus involutus ATCC 200175]|nr:hypothetical protein PAXINDRAFT_167036 [Paxillus involutus ATCC 200175]